MRLRRCHVLLIEPHERRSLDLAAVLAGQARMTGHIDWLARVGHRDGDIPLDPDMLSVLGQLSACDWRERIELEQAHGPALIARLLEQGLLVDETDAADLVLRQHHWHPLAALAQRQLRWRGVDAEAARAAMSATDDARPLLERLGPPPPVTRERGPATARLPLPPAPAGELDRLLARRVTCRNFDRDQVLDGAVLAAVLQRVYGARAISVVSGVPVLKKGTPSAGGLHPVEAYLLVRRVDGIATGLYHYHPLDHALEPLRPLADAEARRLAHCFVAQQDWFVDAPVQVILAARFERNFWKYRQHAKAWRAVILDAGHLSQTQYLVATELGLAAFITAAVNEGDIEDAFGLDPMTEGVLAVTGFGHRAATMTDLEFDPLHAIWPPAATA